MYIVLPHERVRDIRKLQPLTQSEIVKDNNMTSNLIQIEMKSFASGKWILAHEKSEGFRTLDDAIEWANKNLKEWRIKT